MKKLLYITFYFPPCGSSSTARNAGFTGNMKNLGMEPFVLVPEEKTYGKLPHTRLDDSYSDQIKDIRIIRTNTFIPIPFINLLVKLRLSRLLKIFFPFEYHIFWFLPAVMKALEIIEREKIDLIFTSSLPNTSHLIGLFLARRTGLPWFADFQDPMSYRLGDKWFTKTMHRIIARLERAICKRATGIITHSPSSKDILLENCPGLEPEKVKSITNAYDFPLQFEKIPSKSLKMTITHSGEFYSHAKPQENSKKRSFIDGAFAFLDYSNHSADFNPHSLVPLLEAVRKAINKSPQLRSRIEIVLNGYLHPYDEKFIESLGLTGIVKPTGLTSYAQSIDIIYAADLLYFPLSVDLRRKINYWIPGKLPVYLSALKPILALVQEGDSKVILEESGLGIFSDHKDTDALAEKIIGIMDKIEKGQRIINPNIKYIKQFSRLEKTRELVAFIDRLTN